MADLTLAELLMRPVMPEAYDRDRGEPPVMPHARAFGAGVVDPMGWPSGIYNMLAGETINSRWYKDRMQEARNESPVAAGVGSTILPALLGLGGLRAAGQLTSAEALGAFPELMTLGASVSGVKNAIFPSPSAPASDSWHPEVGIDNWAHNLLMRSRARRPQAAYPPGGAY
jgi:hypothetical protein